MGLLARIFLRRQTSFVSDGTFLDVVLKGFLAVFFIIFYIVIY